MQNGIGAKIKLVLGTLLIITICPPFVLAQYGSQDAGSILDFKQATATATSSTTTSAPIAYVAQTPTASATPFSPPATNPPASPPITDPYGSGQSSLFPSSGNSLIPNSGNSSLFPSTGNERKSLFPTKKTETQQQNNPYLPENMQFMRRLIEEFRVGYTFIPRESGKNTGFGLDQFEYQTIFVFPCKFTPKQSPIFLAPGANLYWMNGPMGKPDNEMFDMPPNAFSAFMDVGIEPQLTSVFGIEAWGRIGVHSDYKKVTSESIRLQGTLRGTLNITDYSTAVLGINYIDRQRHKMLPVIGLLWEPNKDTKFRLVFPDPKLSIRLSALDTRSDWWVYLCGEYGGDSWTITTNGETFRTDYNDIRLGIGLEGYNIGAANMKFEFGGAFDREIYAHGKQWIKPSNAVYFKAELKF